MASSSGGGGNYGDGFNSWVKENGGDDDFLGILREFGFTSKLSLSNLKLDQLPEGTELLQRLNCGQQCLLQGLISLAATKSEGYSECARAVESVKRKIEQPSIRSKINKPFNFKSTGCSSRDSSDEDFLPKPPFKTQNSQSKKRRLTASGKGKCTPGKPLPLKKG